MKRVCHLIRYFLIATIFVWMIPQGMSFNVKTAKAEIYEEILSENFLEDEVLVVLSQTENEKHYTCEEGEESGIVKQVYLKGYKRGDKVLRYAQVIVTN